MTEKQLKESVAILYDMECDLFFLDRAIEKIDYQIYRLGNSYSYTPPKQYESKFEFSSPIVATFFGGRNRCSDRTAQRLLKREFTIKFFRVNQIFPIGAAPAEKRDRLPIALLIANPL